MRRAQRASASVKSFRKPQFLPVRIDNRRAVLSAAGTGAISLSTIGCKEKSVRGHFPVRPAH